MAVLLALRMVAKSEITVATSSKPATMETISAVRKAGFRLSMDDFGTGYSSLSYLRQLPVTELKLDQSFVRDIHKDETSRNLSKAVIHIGESMGLTVIAEGVETEEQLSMLCDQKYHVIQGFWYSAPLPGTEIPAWVKNFGIEKEEKEEETAYKHFCIRRRKPRKIFCLFR